MRILRRSTVLAGAALSALLVGACAPGGLSQNGGGAGAAAGPYAGLQTRPVKALSPERVEDLLAGRGASYALAAELNHYPGPKHVLELASQLALQPEQAAAARSLMESMERSARELGRHIVALESELDAAFHGGTLTADELSAYTARIAGLDGRLRAVHLEAHLHMRALLTAEQVAHYDELRGYVAAGQDGSGAAGGGSAGAPAAIDLHAGRAHR